jgi:Fe-S-cluster-containing hydrogenase component 2
MPQKLNERISELQEQLRLGKISRRDFLRYASLLGLSIGAAEALAACAPKATPAPTAPTAVPAKPTAAPAGATAVPPPPAAPVKEALEGHMLMFDPIACTGCLKCATACADKWATEYFPDVAKNTMNLEFARIRPMRFQFVDVVNVCWYCGLIKWAEGSELTPCAQVCPVKAIVPVPKGQGKAGYTGMGYLMVDRGLCLGLEACGRCLEICEDQFGSGISFDPIEKKAQICSRCGGLPACVDACPEPLALQFVPVMRNGRSYAQKPSDFAESLYNRMYAARGMV